MPSYQVPEFPQDHLPACQRLARGRDRAVAAARAVWHAHRRAYRVPVAILIADRGRRRALARELRRGISHLQRALGAHADAELFVFVHEVVSTDRQLAGCTVLGQRGDGSRYALVRLALVVDGHRLRTDEILAVLAEGYIAVLSQHAPAVLGPIELDPAAAVPCWPDEIAPSAGGPEAGVPFAA